FISSSLYSYFTIFSFNVPAPSLIYTLSLHDALPISAIHRGACGLHHLSNRFNGFFGARRQPEKTVVGASLVSFTAIHRGVNENRSEEHTYELQSQSNLVCRLLLEKKKKKK